jgi:hypothetical protein
MESETILKVSQVLIAVTMNVMTFRRDLLSPSSGRKSLANNQQDVVSMRSTALIPEYGSSMLFRNVGKLLSDCTASHLQTQNSAFQEKIFSRTESIS